MAMDAPAAAKLIVACNSNRSLERLTGIVAGKVADQHLADMEIKFLSRSGGWNSYPWLPAV